MLGNDFFCQVWTRCYKLFLCKRFLQESSFIRRFFKIYNSITWICAEFGIQGRRSKAWFIQKQRGRIQLEDLHWFPLSKTLELFPANKITTITCNVLIFLWLFHFVRMQRLMIFLCQPCTWVIFWNSQKVVKNKPWHCWTVVVGKWNILTWSMWWGINLENQLNPRKGHCCLFIYHSG